MRRNAFRLAVAAAITLIAVPTPLNALTAVKPSLGYASASSILMRVTTGLGTATLAADDAIATTGATPRAFAELIAGNTGEKRVGAASRDRNSKGADREELAKQEFTIGNLLGMGLVSASVAASIDDETSASSVDVEVGDVNILNGFARIAGGKSSSDALVNKTLARTTRTVSIGGLKTFALGDLLRALGASPLDLACSAVEDLGQAVNVQTAGTCDQLDQAAALIDSALAAVAGLRADLVALKDSAVAQIGTATASKNAALAQRDSLNAQKATLESQTAGQDHGAIQAARDAQAAACVGLIGALLTACNNAVAALDQQLALFAQLDSVNAQITSANATIDAATASLATLNANLNGLIDSIAAVDAVGTVDATCAGVSDTLDTVSGALPASSSTLDPINTSITSVCNTLSAAIRALIDAPLISMDGVDISIDAIARANDPSIVVTGTVGELKIGLLDPVAIDLSVVGDTVADVESLVSTTLRDIVGLLNLDIPLPVFEFLVTETDKGQRADGTWFAEGSVTAMRITMPSATLSLPDLPPLSLLNDGADLVPRVTPPAGGFAFGASYGAIFAAGITTPAITFDLGTFEAASEFDPSGGGGGGGSSVSGGASLPRTGVGHSALLGFVLLGAALAVKRFALAR